MTGFEPPSSGQKLDFSETAYAGLEVTMDAVSLGALLDIQDLADAAADGLAGAALRKLIARFSGCLESWNVTKNGQPVAPDYDGVLSQDAAFVLAIVRAWQQGLFEAPPPLPGGSGSGGSSAEESTLGLAAASRSLRSS